MEVSRIMRCAAVTPHSTARECIPSCTAGKPGSRAWGLQNGRGVPLCARRGIGRWAPINSAAAANVASQGFGHERTNTPSITPFHRYRLHHYQSPKLLSNLEYLSRQATRLVTFLSLCFSSIFLLSRLSLRPPTMAAADKEFPPPKVLTYPAAAPPSLITQGAEGRLYKTTHLLPDRPCALKYRPPKPYRHPILDARLTKARLASEAKVLERCGREGVPVPAVYAVDPAAGWMMMEWIEGIPVRVGINEWLGERPEDGAETPPDAEEETPLADLMRRIGTAIGALHRTGVVHGDLTTSNMMLRQEKGGRIVDGSAGGVDRTRVVEGDVVLIDFGLATQSMADEDRAVDLYVLERAFASTHPRAERLFATLLESYKHTFKKAPSVLIKLEDVRLRGRKRSMLG